VDLQFQLGEEKTIVTSKIVVSPGVEGQNLTLQLLYCTFFFIWQNIIVYQISLAYLFSSVVFISFTPEKYF